MAMVCATIILFIIIGLFAQKKKRKTVSYLQDINKIKSARRPQEASSQKFKVKYLINQYNLGLQTYII